MLKSFIFYFYFFFIPRHSPHSEREFRSLILNAGPGQLLIRVFSLSFRKERHL